MPRCLACLFAFITLSLSAGAEPTALTIIPESVELKGNFARAQVLAVEAQDAAAVNEKSADLTGAASFRSSDPAVVMVDSSGRLTAVGNGRAEVEVSVGGMAKRVPVAVTEMVDAPRPGFREFITPVLSSAGCNAGSCHASQYGKGGFVLSVIGFDPDLDHRSIARDRLGRRINLVEPEQSLILRKPTMQVSHGGGARLKKGSVDYEILVAWIKAGAAASSNEADVVGIEVFPRQRVLAVDAKQQLRVVAKYSDGRERDVTAWARYDSLDDAVVSVSPEGVVTTEGRGQGSIMVRFVGHARIALFVSPFNSSSPFAGWNSPNLVDQHAERKFRELGLVPSGECDDTTFLRRAFLDAIGGVPSVEETQAFLASSDPEKRSKLVDRLLGLTGDPAQDLYNDRYAAYWTLKWSDLLRNSSDGQAVAEQRMWAMHNWIKEKFRTNRPFDEFVRELIVAKGSVNSSGPASFYEINRSPNDLAEASAQLFLGTRIQCAQCHHHPFEKYGQEDYFAFAGFFSRVGTKTSEEFGIFGRELVVTVKSAGDARHPKTGKTLAPKALDGPLLDHPLDRRIALADWLTAKENKAFARSVVNRYVSYLLGRGLVEPVDDMRGTNPASNPELLDALSDEFIAGGYNLKPLIRTIMTSKLYQRDSQPTPENAADSKFFSHYRVKRIAAEPLLDAIDQVTGSPTKFRNLPKGTRAIELPDAEYPDYFLNTFAKPKRASVCECERTPDESLGQALHTLNGDILANKIADGGGFISKLVKEKKSDEEAIGEVYLRALARPATNSEIASAKELLAGTPNRTEFYQDLLWALINSKQFLFVH
ncbi:DUF1549 domain-containing protein [Planctomyces sp. SH-PL14]|uniref:DUF1549 domain-containing protein n=1 Tax=Planctomyces sp. SH-PL14 TaxID=1632864 RepID=UPI00078D380A|nr:DUF1549 domain-containing protein [Planctomyces sp. SH-PL14]AMV22242.1 Bacterial Ig-like domain (group 2) [Planctomyces sp. SH-PL14]